MMHRYLTPFLVVVISLGVYFLYIDATFNGIKQKLATEKSLDEYLLDAQNAREKLNAKEAEYNSFSPENIARLAVLLPEKIESLRLVIDVANVANEHGLILKSVKVNKGQADPANPAQYIAHTLEFEVSSTYPIFQEFLRNIQRSLALREFAKVSFKQATEGDTTPEGEKKKEVVIDPAFVVTDYQVNLTTYSLQ